jgi:hypothetical protein
MNNNYTSNLPPTVYRYLQKYGSKKWPVQTERQKLFDNVIVVPAVAEYDNINNLLNSLRKNDRKYFSNTLVLFVINNGESASDDVIFNNSQTILLLNNLIGNDQINIGIVDASSQSLCLPDKDAGVGLARKIGMDLALSLFDFASSAKKLLICLDADCELQNNYLAAIVDFFSQNRINAAVVEYEHQLPEDELDKSAIISYEIFLRYYVQGLAYAKSPYAFHAIGSTMICDVESYIKIGGMNKRKAAEDFYFLEKLAKVVNIYKISQTKVYPSSRTSWRVPFGTGQRMNRFLAGTHDEFSLFDPQIFDFLKKWNEAYYSSNIHNVNEFLTAAEKIDPAIKEFLVLNSFEEQWEKILSNSKSEVQIQKQKKIWFDAFRTLKLIHYLRDNVFPNINMFDALDTFFEKINFSTNLSRKDFIPSVEVQYKYLEFLKEAEVITLKEK